MVSLQTALSRKITPEFENLLKRRRLNDGGDDQSSVVSGLKPLDTELHLETPIPPEWQRCLDIKSGQVYFYNTRTNKRMLSDPRSSNPEPPQAAAPPPPPSPHMSLDLELNLPCGSGSSSSSAATSTAKNPNSTPTKITSSSDHDRHRLFLNSTATTASAARAPSWLTFEGEQEMVAAACKKCHMLVMMCKSSPSCPNCKFLHPQEQSSANPLLKRRLSLLC